MGVSRKQLIWLCRGMATMLDAGLPVSRTLTVLSRQGRGGRVQRALEAARAGVEGGATLAEAFDAEGCFPPLFVQLIDAGEASGTLERALAELTRFYEFQQRLWRRFMARIAYPVLQYVAAVAVVSFAFWILRMLDGRGGGLLTGLCIGYGVPAALIGLYLLAVNMLGGTRLCHEVLLRAPVVGGVVRALALARFSLVMYLMSEAAMPVQQALERSLEATNNSVFAARTDAALAAIEDRGSLTDALAATGLFPGEYLNIVAVSEESGKASERFNWLANHYAERAESALGMLVTVISWLLWAAVAAIIIVFIFILFRRYLGALTGAIG